MIPENPYADGIPEHRTEKEAFHGDALLIELRTNFSCKQHLEARMVRGTLAPVISLTPMISAAPSVASLASRGTVCFSGNFILRFGNEITCKLFDKNLFLSNEPFGRACRSAEIFNRRQ
jgi:hypothetical protein